MRYYWMTSMEKKQLLSVCEEKDDVGSYIIIYLLGIFKGETVERYHLTLVESTIYSGIKV